MAHKVYRWVDSEGRPTTPPLDPFEIMEQKSRGGSNRLLSEADERKVYVAGTVNYLIGAHCIIHACS